MALCGADFDFAIERKMVVEITVTAVIPFLSRVTGRLFLNQLSVLECFAFPRIVFILKRIVLVQGFRINEWLSCVLFRAVAARENTRNLALP